MNYIICTLNFFNLLKNSFNLILIIGLVLISVILDQKDSKSQSCSDIHKYQKDLTA